MIITSWNVNGIRSVHKKGLFIPFLNEYKPDIVCLQETKAEKHQNEIDLFGYEEIWSSAVKKGYSGTAIFTKLKPKKIFFGFPEEIRQKFDLNDKYGNTNTEGRLITAEFENFFIISVYTPNAKDDLSRLPLRHEKWDPAFLEYIKMLDQNKPVIFCGDLNVAHTEDDIARPKANMGRKGFTKEEREGIDKIIEAGFTDTFRIFTKGNGHYTWWTNFANARARNIGWRIDYFFVSNRFAKKIKRSEILPNVFGSDHCPILIEI